MLKSLSFLFPGEVSYRIGEKGAVKVLFSSDERAADERTDREVSNHHYLLVFKLINNIGQ